MCRRFIDASSVGRWGRQLEKRRFDNPDYTRARQHALSWPPARAKPKSEDGRTVDVGPSRSQAGPSQDTSIQACHSRLGDLSEPVRIQPSKEGCVDDFGGIVGIREGNIDEGKFLDGVGDEFDTGIVFGDDVERQKFEEIPSDELSIEKWDTVYANAWKYKTNSLQTEARAFG